MEIYDEPKIYMDTEEWDPKCLEVQEHLGAVKIYCDYEWCSAKIHRNG